MRGCSRWRGTERFALLVTLAASSLAHAVVISGLTVTLSGRQATITWRTDTVSNSTLGWGPTSASTVGTYPNQALHGGAGTVHSVTLRYPARGTTYFRVRSSNATGSAESGERTFTVGVDDSFPLGALSFNGRVDSIVPAGPTWYVGGSFTSVGQGTGTGVIVDGTTGSLVRAQFPQVNGAVTVAIPDDAGGFFIGGSFSAVGGLRRNGVAHLLSDQGVDPDFDVDVSGSVEALWLEGNTLFIGGLFSSVNGGLPRGSIAAVERATGVALPFTAEVNNLVEDLVFDSANQVLYVVGGFTMSGTVSRLNAAAFDYPSGALRGWNPRPNGQVTRAVLVGSALYLGGWFTRVSGSTVRNRLAAVDLINGTATSWDPNVNGEVYSLRYDPANATFYVSGFFSRVSGANRNGIAAMTLTGVLLPFDTTDQNGAVFDVAASSGTLYVVRSGASANGAARNFAAAYSLSTGLLTAWDPNLGSSGYAVAVGSGVTPSVFVGGGFALMGPRTAQDGLVAIDGVTGALLPLDARLSGYGVVQTAKLVGTTLFIGGSFSSVDGLVRNNAAALDVADFSPLGWAPNLNGPVNGLDVSPGRVVLGGGFTTVNNTARSYAAEVNATTGALLGSNPSVDGVVNDVLYWDGGVYVVGAFGTAGGVARPGAAAFAFDGGLLPWNPQPNGQTYTVSPVAGALVLGGGFSSVAGVARGNAALVTADLGTLLPWDPEIDGEVYASASGAGVVLLGGYFGSSRGVRAPHVVASDLSTSMPQTYAVSPNDLIVSVGYACDAGLVGLGGHFVALGAAVSGGFGIVPAPPGMGCFPTAGFDAGVDAGFDAGVDAGSDAGVDAGFDAGVDAGFDAGVDAGFDAGVDAGSDAGVDAGFDAGVDAGADAGVDAGADAGVDAGAVAGIDAGADAGVDAGADAGVDAGFDAGVDAGSEAEVDAGDAQRADGGALLDGGSSGLNAGNEDAGDSVDGGSVDPGRSGSRSYGLSCGCTTSEGSQGALLLLGLFHLARRRRLTA